MELTQFMRENGLENHTDVRFIRWKNQQKPNHDDKRLCRALNFDKWCVSIQDCLKISISKYVNLRQIFEIRNNFK